jgi:hypothetical protein
MYYVMCNNMFVRSDIQLKRVDSVFTWVPTHPLLNFYLRHINPFLVCFPSRARDSGVQKWFQNFDLNFFFIKVNS